MMKMKRSSTTSKLNFSHAWIHPVSLRQHDVVFSPAFVTACVSFSALLQVQQRTDTRFFASPFQAKCPNTSFYDPAGGGDPILYQHSLDT
jgi:hypothetical protein